MLAAVSALSCRDKFLNSSIPMGIGLLDYFIIEFFEVTVVKQSSQQLLKIDKMKINPIKYKCN